jgi:hypothetical protein
LFPPLLHLICGVGKGRREEGFCLLSFSLT